MIKLNSDGSQTTVKRVTPNAWTQEHTPQWERRYLAQFGSVYIHPHPISNIPLITPVMKGKGLSNMPPVIIEDDKEPVIIINGKDYHSWRDASEAFFGYNHPNIKRIFDENPQPFELSKLSLIQSDKNYPVFKYGQGKKYIYGLTQLRKKFPEADLEAVTKKFNIKSRVEEIIEQYDLKPYGKRELLVNGVLMSFSEFKDYLKSQGDGISNQTWAKIRDTIYK